MLKELVLRNRSYRRFYGKAVIDRAPLEELIGMARLCPSGANKQALKYILVCDPVDNKKVFPHLAWAGYLKDWPGPAEGERPTAYIIILLDTEVSAGAGCDHGIAAQTILLAAAEKGLGGCMIGSISRKALAQAISLDARYEILLVVALGNPAERVVLEDVGSDGDIQYWRDAESVHHVPKRSVAELIVRIQ